MKPILIALAAFNALNGTAMLLAPDLWYRLVPGASDTGPFNYHFIADIGIAFLASALGLGMAAVLQAPARRAALAPAALFLGGHATLHLSEFAHHPDSILRDMLLVVIPGLLPILILALDMKEKSQ
ncbi:hypothetical protein [Rhizobium alvei]|uniref:DUF4345 domain-containing protein n=1 Tax=Rhizobium alvei TaxID=1132659 RepID=A0ABT8YHI0_9HYPH|nr:hypothetical protein [Rhizobium alvei]MDO6962872.1 hypothetical protein [Rhizobium alvei]